MPTLKKKSQSNHKKSDQKKSTISSKSVTPQKKVVKAASKPSKAIPAKKGKTPTAFLKKNSSSNINKQPTKKNTNPPLKTSATSSKSNPKKKGGTQPPIKKANNKTSNNTIISTSSNKNRDKSKKSLAKISKDSTLASPKTPTTFRKVETALREGKKNLSKQKPTSNAATPKVRTVAKGTSKQSAKKHMEPSEKTKEIILNTRKRSNKTPNAFKRHHKVTPIVFSLEDVRRIIKERAETPSKPTTTPPIPVPATSTVAAKTSTPAPKPSVNTPKEAEPRSLGAASILDILGFNPKEKEQPKSYTDVSDRIPKKFLKYYHLLVELRTHVLSELDLHTEETLKRSTKDDTGNISSYSQHIADAGTDTFDRDFALSLVSSEQEALNEIEDAIQRMLSGNYGVCEITGEKITPERLDAVPFTRFSIEGQKQFEKTHKKTVQRGGVFSETSVAEATHFVEEDV